MCSPSCNGNSSSSEEAFAGNTDHQHAPLSSSTSSRKREYRVTATAALVAAVVSGVVGVANAFSFSKNSPSIIHHSHSFRRSTLSMDDERQQRSSATTFASTSTATNTAYSSSSSTTFRSFTMDQQSSFLESAVRTTTTATHNNSPFLFNLQEEGNSSPQEGLNNAPSTDADPADALLSTDFMMATTTTADVVVDSPPTTWSDSLVSLGLSNQEHTTTTIHNMKERTTKSPTTKIRASVKETGAESMSYYLKTMANHELLQASEEVILAREIQKLCQYEDIRTSLEYDLLRPPTYAEWAKRIHPNLTVQGLKRQIRRSQRAKAALTESNLRLVISIARRYINRGLNFQDLCQEGIFGLTKACEKFDPELGFRFSTYSTWWIKQGIMRAIADQGRTIRLPVHIHDQLNTIRKTEQELRDELGRPPTSLDIANKLGISEERVDFIKNKGANSVSMESPINSSGAGAKGSKAGGGSSSGDKETTVQDMVGDPGQRPMDEAFNQMFRDDMSRLISTLNSREQAVVRMRFGLDDGKAKTLEEIGRRFSVTRERIRQIEARALHKLRQPYRNYSVKCYADEI
mmetsp:Transcript_1315/g.2021  ORF Transcript_1315/g.2021 Transcript_1315/m.2021 type:complete len:576 (-) Transcript_1315:283-2010(-)|eukprot:CAMPEP_0172414306 /NCGR_PEP_ID=MMETSP1064-20121228/982_1 /TAXON_ID=202472 /ORGANISM="Aulacoseira subarctica , Strain CCAP 1002/5" /LENGTH=575 /DNA_ID=CAMNT_0013150917 /DNA_START=120 /DNA_END=1847 /DNA_ORIENTATION=+